LSLTEHTSIPIIHQALQINKQAILIHNMHLSGLGENIVAEQKHYMRSDSIRIWNRLQHFIDVDNLTGWVWLIGLPGVGKFTLLFGFAMAIATDESYTTYNDNGNDVPNDANLMPSSTEASVNTTSLPKN
jgi:hypothetical protein